MIYCIETRRETFLVQGDIEAWLRDRNAKPREKGGYKIGGRVVLVSPMSPDAATALARIFPGGAADRALEAEKTSAQ